MTAPLPQDAPGYNTTPRPRPRKSKFFAPPKDLEGFYSPFWPLLIVFISFMFLLAYQISFLRHRAMMLDMQIKRLAEPVKNANAQMVFIQGLHTDLAALAPTHPAAAGLIKVFFPVAASSPAATDSSASKETPGETTLPSAPASGTALPPATVPPHPSGK